MSASNDGGSTAGFGGMTLDDFVGEAFGDAGASDEGSAAGSVESPGSNAGAPPAANPDPSAASPEGAPAAEHAGDPPAVAATNSPDPNAGTAQPTGEPDPLASATSLTYTVAGETRTYDGIRVLGEHGAVIPPEHLQKVQQRLSERDHLFEQNQQRHQAYTNLERLTSWQTRDAQGATKTLTGFEAIAERQSVMARSLASLDVILKEISDPAKFAGLVAVVEDGAGNPVITLDQNALNGLMTRAELAAIKADGSARAHIATLARPAAPSAPAERPMAEIAPITVDAQLSALKLNVPADSRQFLIGQLPRYVRPTTPEERAADPTLGPKIVDAEFVQLIRREAQATANTRAVADAANAVGKSNAAALAAAALGARGRTPGGRPNAPATPAAPASDPQSEMWARRERAAAGAF